MEIKTSLDLSVEESKSLSEILGCEERDLNSCLEKYSNAALEELTNMFLGKKVLNRGSDILEYRLFLLIMHAFDGKIPNEQEICRLFQTKITVSRSLIRAVMSKYQYQLKSKIENSLKELLDKITISEDKTISVSVHNLNLVEELNLILANKDTNLPPVQKKKGSVSTYILFNSSYGVLCEHFRVTNKITQLEENNNG